jgi:hypothetical protein
MAEAEPRLPQPGPAPRNVGLSRLLEMSPLYLSIAAIVVPLVFVSVGIWALLAPSKQTVGLLILPLIVLPVVLAMLWRLKSLLVHGTAVQATITSVEESKEMGGGAIATYRYMVGGNEYEQRHTFNTYGKARARWFVSGAQIWAVVSPKSPSRAVPWV